MRHITRVEFPLNLVIIRYNDDDDPQWVDEQVLVADWQKHPHVQRLAHVAYHALLLLVEHPEKVRVHDEVLQEWLGRLFDEHPAEGHDAP